MMKKNYFLIYFLMFFSVSMLQSQTTTESLTKKEKRALKKLNKKKTAVIKETKSLDVKTETPSLEEQMERIVNPQTKPIKENQDRVQVVNKPTEVLMAEISREAKEVVVNKPNGVVNWTQQYIEAVGQSVIDNEKFKNPAQAKLMATRGAIVIAQRNLLEIVKGVSIIGETTVQDMITTSDYVYSRVEGVVKGAKQVGEAIEKNGFIEVRLKMPLYGQESLANTMNQQALDMAKKKNGFVNSDLLLNEGSETGEGIDGSNPILFNIENGTPLDPSMFPVIVDDNGQVLFDFSKIYNPKQGKFPQYLQMGKDILHAMGNQKGVDIINMVQTGKGQFKIPEKSSKNVFWNKVGKIAQDVGQVLFKLIF